MTYELGQGTGPLRGTKVVELAGIGPGAHACLILADLGADVIRLERPDGGPFGGGAHDVLTRSRPRVAIDLKHRDAPGAVLDLVEGADVLIEGMRPGATERLGLGPEECWARNARMVYGRMTGWGQTGPLAQTAGHDLTYIGITGALDGLGQDRARPHFPTNLLGDFGGGSTYLVIGVLAALLEARASGRGQVVDAAIVDGTAHLNAMSASLLATGLAGPQRSSGLLDGGTPFYDLYETADGRHMSVAALEPQFYAELVDRLGLADELPDRNDPGSLREIRDVLTRTFRSRIQADWLEVFDGSDACVGPVVAYADAPDHPHLKERGTFVERDGITQPAPAPRFSRTEATISRSPGDAGADTRAALTAWGLDAEALLEAGAVAQSG
ncbi:MAG: CaiB/BaiF CoA transferase family protein [Nocardioides sp.]